MLIRLFLSFLIFTSVSVSRAEPEQSENILDQTVEEETADPQVLELQELRKKNQDYHEREKQLEAEVDRLNEEKEEVQRQEQAEIEKRKKNSSADSTYEKKIKKEKRKLKYNEFKERVRNLNSDIFELSFGAAGRVFVNKRENLKSDEIISSKETPAAGGAFVLFEVADESFYDDDDGFSRQNREFIESKNEITVEFGPQQDGSQTSLTVDGRLHGGLEFFSNKESKVGSFIAFGGEYFLGVNHPGAPTLRRYGKGTWFAAEIEPQVEVGLSYNPDSYFHEEPEYAQGGYGTKGVVRLSALMNGSFTTYRLGGGGGLRLRALYKKVSLSFQGIYQISRSGDSRRLPSEKLRNQLEDSDYFTSESYNKDSRWDKPTYDEEGEITFYSTRFTPVRFQELELQADANIYLIPRFFIGSKVLYRQLFNEKGNDVSLESLDFPRRVFGVFFKVGVHFGE